MSSVIVGFRDVVDEGLGPLSPTILAVKGIRTKATEGIVTKRTGVRKATEAFSERTRRVVRREIGRVTGTRRRVCKMSISISFRRSDRKTLVGSPNIMRSIVRGTKRIFSPSRFARIRTVVLKRSFTGCLRRVSKYFTFVNNNSRPTGRRKGFSFSRGTLVDNIHLVLAFMVMWSVIRRGRL